MTSICRTIFPTPQRIPTRTPGRAVLLSEAPRDPRVLWDLFCQRREHQNAVTHSSPAHLSSIRHLPIALTPPHVRPDSSLGRRRRRKERPRPAYTHSEHLEPTAEEHPGSGPLRNRARNQGRDAFTEKSTVSTGKMEDCLSSHKSQT